MLKDAKTATEHNKKLAGLYIAEVINDIDEKNRNRIQVDIKGITSDVQNKESYPWAEQGSPIARGLPEVNGISVTPSIGELVYVLFLNGSPSHPVYFAMARGAGDKSPHNEKNYVIQTPEEQIIMIGDGLIKIWNHNSFINMTPDDTDITVAGSNIHIEDGLITIDNGDSVITMSGADVNVNTSNFSVDCNSFQVDTGSFNVDSGSFTHNGTNVGDDHTHGGINPGSSSTDVPD